MTPAGYFICDLETLHFEIISFFCTLEIQEVTEPLPLPILTLVDLEVTGILGKILIQILSILRLILRISTLRAASI